MHTTQTIAVSATGTAKAEGPGTLYGVTLTAAAADATIVVRDGGASGAVLARLAAKAGTTAETQIPRYFKTDLHVTLAGASATAELFV